MSRCWKSEPISRVELGDGGGGERRQPGSLESREVLAAGRLGRLESDEALERRQPERLQQAWDAEVVVPRPEREVGAAQRRRLADRGQQIADEPEVLHLLAGYEQQARAPLAHQLELLPADALLGSAFHREPRVQVLAEQPVLELGRLGEQIGQALAATGRLAERRHRRRAHTVIPGAVASVSFSRAARPSAPMLRAHSRPS